MMERIKKHIWYYLVFGIVQLLGFGLVVFFAGNKPFQFSAILGTTIFYFVFAITHHILDHDLNGKIVVEYALIGCIGLSISLILFNA